MTKELSKLSSKELMDYLNKNDCSTSLELACVCSEVLRRLILAEKIAIPEPPHDNR